MNAKPKLINEGPNYATAGLVYRVQEPIGPGPHPTVVMLHGRLGNEDVMWIFQRTLPENWLVVAPRAHLADPDGGYSWYLQPKTVWPPLSEFDEAVTAVVRFIDVLPDLHGADPSQIYLMGFSQGAATSYATAIAYPELVQAIAGLVGFIPEKCGDPAGLTALYNTPVFMAVGKEDPLIPYEKALACANTLRAAGADLEMHEYDTGHKLNAQGIRDLTDWWGDRSRALNR